jgi:D-3-phosphoglycerate dehydrogenase
MAKVLVTDNLSSKGVEIFKETPGIDVEVRAKVPPDELKGIIKDFSGLVVRSGTKVTAEVVQAADSLKVVGRAGIGLDNVDVHAASKRGIVVMNTPGGNTITTAEHAFSLLLALARRIPQATASMKSGKWEKSKFMGTEIYGHTLGIIGIGRIGGVVAERAKAFGMNVITYDPHIAPEVAKRLGVELVSLDEVYQRSHFITIHTPLTDDTRNLVNAKAFERMKDRVKIINCARGGIINEQDLLEAIKSGKVEGAALDVYSEEPPKDNPLVGLDQVICTPHLGASTEEAQEKVAVAIAEQIIDYLVHGLIRNAANVPSVEDELLTVIRPYLNLGEKLGGFLGQICKGALEAVEIEYSGEMTNYPVAPITVALLKGLLSPVLEEEDVNYVSAPALAKERGIRVVESTTSAPEDFTTLVDVRVKTTEGENEAAGTIFGKSDPWIVRVNQFLLEVVPDGPMLLFDAQDRPGVIGNIGTVLGEHGLNISRMQFGREQEEGEALVILNMDGSVPAEVVDQLKALPYVQSVQYLSV